MSLEMLLIHPAAPAIDLLLVHAVLARDPPGCGERREEDGEHRRKNGSYCFHGTFPGRYPSVSHCRGVHAGQCWALAGLSRSANSLAVGPGVHRDYSPEGFILSDGLIAGVSHPMGVMVATSATPGFWPSSAALLAGCGFTS